MKCNDTNNTGIFFELIFVNFLRFSFVKQKGALFIIEQTPLELYNPMICEAGRTLK